MVYLPRKISGEKNDEDFYKGLSKVRGAYYVLCMLVADSVIRLPSVNITMLCYLFMYFVLYTVSITSVSESKKKIVSQNLMGHCLSKVMEDS